MTPPDPTRTRLHSSQIALARFERQSVAGAPHGDQPTDDGTSARAPLAALAVLLATPLLVGAALLLQHAP